MKIYTKTGDHGRSSLFSGERVLKNHARMKAYGDIDELNSTIGALAAALPGGIDRLPAQLRIVQTDLFSVGAWLATTPGSAAADQLAPMTGDKTQQLESFIDILQNALPELKSFVLPGGHPAAAWAHIARTVCRRAERHAIELLVTAGEKEQEPFKRVLTPVMTYLNRLSDYLFVAARYCNQAMGVDDVPWRQ